MVKLGFFQIGDIVLQENAKNQVDSEKKGNGNLTRLVLTSSLNLLGLAPTKFPTMIDKR